MIWTFIKDVCRYLERKDSESACLLIIDVSNDLNEKDLQQMADYFLSLKQLKKS